MLKALRRAIRPVAGLVMPPTCAVSGEPLGHGALKLSARLMREIGVAVEEPYCFMCGTTLPASTVKRDGCARCEGKWNGVRTLVRVGEFVEPLSQLVMTTKFGGRWDLPGAVAPFVMQAMELARAGGALPPVNVLVPVPLHWRRYLQRGFDQGEELARAIGKLGGWRVEKAIKRVRQTQEQARTLGPRERRVNMRSAFAARRGVDLRGRHVWLVDDVRTTGATLAAAAKVLTRLPRERRPASVNAVVICVTQVKPV